MGVMEASCLRRRRINVNISVRVVCKWRRSSSVSEVPSMNEKKGPVSMGDSQGCTYVVPFVMSLCLKM